MQSAQKCKKKTTKNIKMKNNIRISANPQKSELKKLFKNYTNLLNAGGEGVR